MSKERKAIINADDYGYSPGCNRGIEEAYRNGVLTSTTVMGNIFKDLRPLFELQSDIVKPPIGVGVHLNLTYDYPLSTMWSEPKFTRPHKGTGKPEEWNGSTWEEYFSQFPTEDVIYEFRQQILRVETQLPDIDHLDSHQGAASYSTTEPAYRTVAKDFNLAVRHISPLSENPVYGGEFRDVPFYAEALRAQGIRTTDRRYMKYYYGEKDPVGAFLRDLETVQEGEVVEFMVHPAEDNDQGDWRLTDLKMLTDIRTINGIRDLGISLTTYGNSAY